MMEMPTSSSIRVKPRTPRARPDLRGESPNGTQCGSVGAISPSPGRPKAGWAPLGGSDGTQCGSVGAISPSPGRPKAGWAPLGGSDGTQCGSVGAISIPPHNGGQAQHRDVSIQHLGIHAPKTRVGRGPHDHGHVKAAPRLFAGLGAVAHPWHLA